jgi:hypothetical protein
MFPNNTKSIEVGGGEISDKIAHANMIMMVFE